jgi:hypothetical protein
VEDTHGCITTGAAWKFTAKVAGRYVVTGVLYNTTGVASAVWYKNGLVGNTDYVTMPNNQQAATLGFSFKLAAGEYFDLRAAAAYAHTGVIQITRMGS